MEIRCLEAILDHNMTPMEARAYKIMCLYNDIGRRKFPEQFRFKKPKGDPRKKLLFKYCYKLLRETNHKLDDKEYFFYIHAQMDVIKMASEKHDHIPTILPTCLVGEGAWKRWLMWKSIFDQRKKQAENAEAVGIDFNNVETVKRALSNDYETMQKRLKELSYESVTKATDNRAVARWIATKLISPYYAILSPILNDWLKKRNLTLDSVFHVDFALFRPGITKETKEYFNGIFQHEYRSTG